MPALFEHRLTVVEIDIDGLGHANNVSYFGWMQSAALAHSAVQGWPPDRYQTFGSGFVVRSHQINYLRPAFVGDELLIRTWVATFRKATSLRRYDILRRADEKLLASAATDWAFVNYSTGMPARIPAEVSQAFELLHIAGDPFVGTRIRPPVTGAPITGTTIQEAAIKGGAAE